jgi:low affinity Fe/Cu permease
MITAQIELVLNEYARVLDERMAHHQVVTIRHEQLHHVRQMIPKTIQFLYDQRREKAMRWLGFIQGALWSHGIYSIEEMKQHNKPIGK